LLFEGEDDHMKKHEHTAEPVARKLRQCERLLSAGRDPTEELRQLEIADIDLDVDSDQLEPTGRIDGLGTFNLVSCEEAEATMSMQ
jgi:hypothetical protein